MLFYSHQTLAAQTRVAKESPASHEVKILSACAWLVITTIMTGDGVSLVSLYLLPSIFGVGYIKPGISIFYLAAGNCFTAVISKVFFRDDIHSNVFLFSQSFPWNLWLPKCDLQCEYVQLVVTRI